MTDFIQILTAYANGFVTMTFLAYALFLRAVKNRNRLQTVLMNIMFIWTLLLAKDIVYMHPAVAGNMRLYRTLLCIDNIAVVMGALYAMELVKPGSTGRNRVIAHILPFVILSLTYSLSGSGTVYNIYMAYTIIYCTVVLTLISRYTAKYVKAIRNMYSDLTYKDIRWMWSVVALLLGALISWINIFTDTDYLTDMIFYVFLTFSWSIIFVKTVNHMTLSDEEAAELLSDAADSVQRNEDSCRFKEKLEELVKQNYFINNPGITLTALASELCTNRTTLSSYLNNEKGCTFYDFVNSIKCEYSAELLSGPSGSSLTYEELAEKSGFNSLSTFKRSFEKKYGMTPAKYRRTVNAGR